MFNEGFIDTELFWLSFGDIITYSVIATVIIAEIGFATWLLLRWLRKNIDMNWSPVLNIGESARRRVDSSIETFEEKVKKPLSKKILFENMKNHTVTIDYIGEDYTFQQPTTITKAM